MADVKIYGLEGDYLSTETAQIATQYAYGDGEMRSCQLSREAVSTLLYDIPINDYLSLNMAGIAPITDQIGGVEITIPEDYTAIDPAFVQGSTIVLNGELSENIYAAGIRMCLGATTREWRGRHSLYRRSWRKYKCQKITEIR